MSRIGRGVSCKVSHTDAEVFSLEDLVSIEIYGDTLTLTFMLDEGKPGQEMIMASQPSRKLIELDFSGSGINMKLVFDARYERISQLNVNIEDPMKVGVDLKILETTFHRLGS